MSASQTIKCRIVWCFDGDDQTKFVFHHCDAVTTHHRCCDENIIENCFSPPPHSKFRAQLLHFWKRRKQIRRKLKANVKSRKMELFEASETWWLWKSWHSKTSPRWRVKISSKLCCAGCDSDTEWTQREQRGGWTYFRFFDKTCLHLLTMCGLWCS